jgi:hypothetical protein
MNKKQATPITQLLEWMDMMLAVHDSITVKSIRDKAISLLPKEEAVIKESYKQGSDDMGHVHFSMKSDYENEGEYFAAEFDQYNSETAAGSLKNSDGEYIVTKDELKEDIEKYMQGFREPVLYHYQYPYGNPPVQYFSEQAVADMIYTYLSKEEKPPQNNQ